MHAWMDGTMYGGRVDDLEGVDDELVHSVEQFVACLEAVRCFDVHAQVLMEVNSDGVE